MNETNPGTWYRPARRNDRSLDREGAMALLDRATFGILAMADRAGQPYAVPLSYGRDGDRIYFHSAMAGQKLDFLRDNPLAVLCVTEPGEVAPGETPCATTITYRSVLVFGRVSELAASNAKKAALDTICRHHGIAVPPDGTPAAAAYSERAAHTVVLELAIEHVSGKARG